MLTHLPLKVSNFIYIIYRDLARTSQRTWFASNRWTLYMGTMFVCCDSLTEYITIDYGDKIQGRSKLSQNCENDYYLRHVCPSAPCLSIWNTSAPKRRIFMKLDIWKYFENLSRKFNFEASHPPCVWSNYTITKYVLPICSEENYIFSHRLVHWVHNYMFRPCILVIVRLYCKLNKHLYNLCLGYCEGEQDLVLH
jgi:hypothetical protein